MLIKLNDKKKRLISEYCEERFGMPKKLLLNFELYEGSKNKIYLIKKIPKIRIKPESAGLCIFRLDKTPKPTTNFLQLFGNTITKNIFELKGNELIDFCSGNDLNINTKELSLEPGFIAVKYKRTIVGCAHYNMKILKNQLPKSRHCKINYC